MKSIFALRGSKSVIYETNEYSFIIPRNVVIEIDDKSFSISGRTITLSKNKVLYLVRDMSKKGLL